MILADEPVSSVDPTLAHSIVNLLMDLASAVQKTLVMNLHSVDLALAYFPRIVGFRDGRVAFDRTPDAVTDDFLGDLYGALPAAAIREESPSAEHIRSSTPVLRQP